MPDAGLNVLRAGGASGSVVVRSRTCRIPNYVLMPEGIQSVDLGRSCHPEQQPAAGGHGHIPVGLQNDLPEWIMSARMGYLQVSEAIGATPKTGEDPKRLLSLALFHRSSAIADTGPSQFGGHFA